MIQLPEYKPQVRESLSEELIYTCASGNVPARANDQDKFLYTGSGLVCYWTKTQTTLAETINNCEICRVYCSFSNKICPSSCQCRW
jgi:hypothetical protein